MQCIAVANACRKACAGKKLRRKRCGCAGCMYGIAESGEAACDALLQPAEATEQSKRAFDLEQHLEGRRETYGRRVLHGPRRNALESGAFAVFIADGDS